MAIQALYSAATGMDCMQTKLDVIANNLANVETTGFKSDRANFEDLLYRHYKMPGVEDSAGQFTPTGIAVGLGARCASTQTNFTQGAVKETSNPTDLCIQGRGFFQVQNADGTTSYTRAGNFSVNANGYLVVGSANTGRLLQPPITIPTDATAISVSAEGIVTVAQPGNTQQNQVGRIELASFINPQGLLKMGENLYTETASSGAPTLGNPGQDGLGTLQQNALEASNVEPTTELIELITTQRSFEMNSQAIKAGDSILQTISNLRSY